MDYKISEIVKEFRESCPEEIYKANKSAFNAGNITAILENMGLLYFGEKGRRPTEYGQLMGITEELRTGADGKEYWQVLYPERARELVREIIFRNYPDLDPDRSVTFSHTVTARFAGSGINASRNIASEYPGHVIILHGASRFWAFEDSADVICREFGLQSYVNAEGIRGFSTGADVFDEVIFPQLLNGERSFIINKEDGMHIYSAVRRPVPAPVPAAAPAETGRKVRYGHCVELEDQFGELFTVFLARREHSERTTLHLVGGQLVRTTVPTTEYNGIRILSPETELSRTLIGSRENTVITCNGIEYRILRVWRDSEVNDTTIQ